MQIDRYSAPARAIHWTMAALIVLMIPAGLVMVQPGLDRSLQNALFVFHKNTGVLLLLLVILRVFLRFRYAAPALPTTLPPLQARAAGASHMALYLLMIVVPLAGYIRVRAGGFPIESLDAMGLPGFVPRSDALAETAKTVHYFSSLALAAIIGLHIAAACFHGIVKRDGVFSRIWPPLGGGLR